MKMYLRSIVLLVLLFLSASLYAVEKSNEADGSFNKNRISLAYGFMSAPHYSYEFGDMVSGLFASLFESVEEVVSSSIGPISFAYYRNVTKHVSLGFVITYESYQSETIYASGENEVDNFTLYTVMPNCTLRYGWKSVSFYNGIALGVGLMKTENKYRTEGTVTDTFAVPAFHLYILGINFNLGDKLSLFSDVGVGVLGTLNIGMACNL